MTTLKTTTAPVYAHTANSPELAQQFDAFINELVEGSMSVDALAQALSGGIDDLPFRQNSILMLKRTGNGRAKCSPSPAVCRWFLRNSTRPSLMRWRLTTRTNSPLTMPLSWTPAAIRK